MEKLNLIPELRFSEFTEEWVEKKLGEVADDFSYGMNSAATIYDGTNKYIRITDIDENTRTFSPNPLTSPNGTIETKFRLQKGDMVFARTGASVGKSYLYNNDDGNLYFAGFLIKVSIEKASEKFIFFQTLRSNYNKWVKVMSMRSGQPGINAQEYRNFKFIIPNSLPEQTKIATFLTAVDKRINLLQKKKTELEQYKKGVMQKIFVLNHDYKDLHNDPDFKNQGNQDNQTKSRFRQLRFKKEDGSDFEDWEVKKLGEVAKFFSGGTPRSTNKNYYSGNIPFIGSGDISKNEVNSFITKEAFSSCSAKMVAKGDLLYALYGATSGEVSISKMDGAINQAVLCIRISCNTYLLREILNYNKGKIVSKFLQGGQGNLSANIIRNLKFVIPNSLLEQQKIANFLSSIDKSIENISNQIDDSVVFKKGLLQQLFV